MPAARDAAAVRITVMGPDGVLGAVEHSLDQVSASTAY